jgi:hypothetical protein
MAQLSTKIKQYVNAEVDFLKDVLLQDDGQGAYIKEWNLATPKPTLEQLNAYEAQATTYENNQKLFIPENSSMDPGTSSLKKFTIMV